VKKQAEMTPVHVEVEKNIKNVAENQFKKVKEEGNEI
jgi:hypothetical protein